MYQHKYNDLQCSLEFNGYTGVNTSTNSFTNQPGSICCSPQCHCCYIYCLPTMPSVDDGTLISYWFFGDLDYFFIVTKLGGRYANAYCGLIHRHFSNDPYPCLVIGSWRQGYFDVDCTCCNWCYCLNPIPWRRCTVWCAYYTVYGAYQRNTGNSGWWCYGSALVYRNPIYKCCTYGVMLAHHYYNLYSSRSHGFVLSPIYVDYWNTGPRGELKYVYWTEPSTLPSESVVYVGGDPYIVFNHRINDYTLKIAVRYYE